MDIRNRKELHAAAVASLAAAPGQPRQAAALYAAIGSVLALLSAVISFILNNQIAQTGGLSNMGLRSMLSTAQSVLPVVQMVVMLCLGLGYHMVALNVARNRHSGPDTLPEGFRRFGPLVRTTILQYLIYFGIGFAAMYASVYIFLMLPVSRDFYEIMMPIVGDMSALDTALTLDDATLIAATNELAPMLWSFLAVFLIAFLPIYYQHRMVMFCLVDEPGAGAFRTLRSSSRMMRRNCIALLKLDLSFWWYYLLQTVVTVVCYGDILLPMVGITLPWSGTVSYFVFYVLSLILQFVVYYFFMNRVNVTYAMAYESIRPKPQETKVALGNIFDM